MESAFISQVTEENNSKNRGNTEKRSELIQGPTHTKTTSAVTTKEQSVSSNPLKNKSYLSYSNKVSERKEEDEESSQLTKQPRKKIDFESKNIIELCDQFDDIIEEESQFDQKEPEKKLSYGGLVF